jgi:hypothetical protein
MSKGYKKDNGIIYRPKGGFGQIGMWFFIPKDKIDFSLSRRVIRVYIFGKILVALNVAFLYPLVYISLVGY